jgi:hypothetical protein
MEAPPVKDILTHAPVLLFALGGFALGVCAAWADDTPPARPAVLERGRTIEATPSSSLPVLPLQVAEGTDGDASRLSPFKSWNAAQVQVSNQGEWGSLTSQVVLSDPIPTSGRSWEDPLHRWEWKREDSWNMPVAGPLSVFGQLGANSGEVATTDLKLSGKTGLACKVPLGEEAEVQVRSGPSFTCTDPLRMDVSGGHSAWLLELQARCPLIWGIGLNCGWTASPALTAQDRDLVSQDVSLAVPVGAAGKLRFGARRQWDVTTPQPSPNDSTQVYLGLELKR